MKIILSVLMLLIPNSGYSKVRQSVPAPHPLEMPLDMTGAEYRREWSRQLELGSINSQSLDKFSQIREVGTRNLNWLIFINLNRKGQAPLSFTSAESQLAFPIETPNFYNPSLIQEQFNKLITELPPSMKSVLLGGAPFTVSPPIDTNEYLKWGRELDRSYQIAIRWVLLEPYLDYYAKRKAEDIRGFYFLSRLPERSYKLAHYPNLDDKLKSQIFESLVGMCINENRKTEGCKRQVGSEIRLGHDLNQFFSTYEKISKTLYDSFFEIQGDNARMDLDWSPHNSKSMFVPFRTVSSSSIADFLTYNLSDEWKFTDWKLQLRFQPEAQVRVDFVPGSLPHVDRVGGDIITMDGNAPLEEYNVQWTIRHEFGHVLGFPDCYFEFYDDEKAVMIQYQIDTTDLMCSRRGHLKERHYNELKRWYLK